ncbi:hypothetical protein BKA03_000248 [Demequina lutea]|uniref:Uncharacterized protein n=1 Tax=Demequina lutea TaxID=431489 RepID=A0A7Y9Z7E6_9MICO|nr:hypothetical protein [Demequina lutea]
MFAWKALQRLRDIDLSVPQECGDDVTYRPLACRPRQARLEQFIRSGDDAILVCPPRNALDKDGMRRALERKRYKRPFLLK